MTYIHCESAFIIMSTEQGLFLWTPTSGVHVFRALKDNELWIYGVD